MMKKLKAKNIVKEILDKSEKTLSHQEIKDIVGEQFDRVTVYRALHKLMQDGVIHRVVDIEGVSKYAVHRQDNPRRRKRFHVHFSCNVCKETTCIDQPIPKVRVSKHHQILDASFLLSGVCPSCTVY